MTSHLQDTCCTVKGEQWLRLIKAMPLRRESDDLPPSILIFIADGDDQLHATAILSQVEFNGNMLIIYFVQTLISSYNACCCNLGPKYTFLELGHTFMLFVSCLLKIYQAHNFCRVRGTVTQLGMMM
jgi:hypothetical protein